VGDNPKLGQGPQATEVVVADPPNLKHVVGADDHAVAFGFTTSVIDNWGPGFSWGIAPLPRTVWVLRGPAFLVKYFFLVTHGLSSPLVATIGCGGWWV
jgi:hypothetical protein